MKKKILVTGGAGYIGSALVPELLNRGYDVRVLDKLVFTDLGITAVKDKIELIVDDVKTVDSSILDGVDAIIHLAGLSTEPTSYYNPRHTDLVNHIATERLAYMAKKAGIDRFVFGSSCSIYFTYSTGEIPDTHTEDWEINSISPYSLSKRSAELALLELADDNFKPVIFRKGTVYGYSPKMRWELVLNSFTKDAFRNKKINVHSKGVIYRPMLDIHDAVEAYIAGIEKPIDVIGGQIYNLVSENFKIADLALSFKDILKKEKGITIDIDFQDTGPARNYMADNTKFKKFFNPPSTRPLSSAITELYDALENGEDHTDPRYYNDIWQQEMIKSKKFDKI